MLIKGRVWKFGDDMNTDLMMPQDTFRLSIEEQARAVFRVNRPGWADQVKQGDIIVAGKNFGIGSSRPAARTFKFLGIEAIIADSINGLFLRNCINFGLPGFSLPGIVNYFQELELAEIDLNAGTIKNLNTETCLKIEVLPEMLMKIIDAGGIIELLQKEGYVAPFKDFSY
jgi:3-isopropylmalate/(R)-2-methylmalate dehydratase small subunit